MKASGIFVKWMRASLALLFGAALPEGGLLAREDGSFLVLQPLVRIALEAERFAAETDRSRRLAFFEAIADNDRETVRRMLNAGMDANTILPNSPPREFTQRFTDEQLSYYIAREQGFSALMFASCLGNLPVVNYLLGAGADPFLTTKRHKTFALWLAAQNGHIHVMRRLMGIAQGHESLDYQITIDLGSQTASLLKKGAVQLSVPISSGRTKFPTPKGSFLVTNKYKHWRSTLYHAEMPYFLRLSCSDFGLHAGILPGYPASHGCVRLNRDDARELFSTIPVGTLVVIK